MENAKTLLNNLFEDLTKTLQQTIRFNTEKSAPAPNAPFGQNVKDCLTYVLNVAQQMGFDIYDCDGYAGHVDLKGTTDQILGVVGHLDVVPAKAEEWLYPPYSATIANGKMFGRGTMDDKGPMIACLFALKALKESGFVPTKTIRLIFGCDEESGMQCVKHYFTKMPHPTVAFSPDGDFPVINCEKGIYQFAMNCGALPTGVTLTAGERVNVVPSKCTTTSPIELQIPGATHTFANGVHTYVTLGKGAHGSTPNEGVNATHPAIVALAKAYPNNQPLQLLTKVMDTSGAAWGIGFSDQASGALTCNIGVLTTLADGTLEAMVDIRFPASLTCNQMLAHIKTNSPQGVTVVGDHCKDPMLVPADSHLVSTLMDVYNTQMNVHLKPLAIGGGTYSRCLNCDCVAFGPLFPNEEQTIHMPNECINLDNLRAMAHLYMEAMYRLAK